MGHVDIPLVSDPALCLWCASVHTTSAFIRWRSALIRSLTLRHCGTLCRRSLTLCHRGTLCLLQQQVEERSHSVTDPAPSQHTLQEVTDHAPSRHTLPSPSVFQVYAATAGRFKVSDICIYIYISLCRDGARNENNKRQRMCRDGAEKGNIYICQHPTPTPQSIQWPHLRLTTWC